MTTQEINIANALLSAKEALTQLVQLGLSKESYLLELANVIAKKHQINVDQSIIVIEQSFELI